jgi:crotonobetainyl-CoA:carnitine CoA-transferase CaiB-like acyl-CoA transferase
VLELATWVATPLSATLLADLGARVIKLEPPGGEPFRQVAYGRPWLKTIQGKQSLAIDLKRPEAREIVRRLVERADALVHNYRPGVPERLGIDYESVRAWNPRLVYLYGASYGSTGPCSARPAYHPTAGALCGGALAQAGAGSIPPPDAPLDTDALRRLSRRLELANETNPDPTAGVASASALLMALYHRERTGQGQYLETSMLCSNAWALAADFVDWDGRPARETPDAELLGLGPRYRLYRTAEGWVFLGCPTPRGFERFARAVGREDWLREPLPADAELAAQIEQLLAARPAAEWEALLTSKGIACVVADQGPFARFAYGEPWMREAGFVVDLEDSAVGPYTRFGPTVRLSRDHAELRGPSLAGEQTREILGELGYAAPDIAALGAAGVVAWPREAV